jgi:uncharacterized protein (DUF1501 family)
MANLNRRQFLAGVLGAGAAAGLVPLGRAVSLGEAARLGGPRLTALTDLLGASAEASTAASGPLVLCTLSGGNDGLNTVVPYNDGIYQDWRGAIAIPPDQVLPIGTFDDVDLGFHPSMTGLQSLFNAGHVAVICGVEYPNPNFSHFQSTTIWQTADVSGELSSGWLGRWLDATGTDPLRALSIGPTLPQALVGAEQQASTLSDSTSAGAQQPSQNSTFMAAYQQLMAPYKDQIELERAVADAGGYLIEVGQNAAAALGAETPPPDPSGRNAGDIGNQLAVVAECIQYGLTTDVYSVGLGSFDTHSNQLGTHASLLSQLDAGIEDFMGDFTAPSAGKSPVIVIYSEFGRTSKVNSSNGTDHSSASVVLVVGPGVKGGFYGEVPSFTRLDPYGNILYTTDFRRVYATVLEDVLGFDSARILGRSFANLGFV